MTNHNRGRKARKWYRVGASFWGGVPGLTLENKDQLRGDKIVFTRDEQKPGFAHLPEMPRFRHDKKEGRLPKDIDDWGSYWLVSEAMKAVLDEVDPKAFAFARCDLRLADGVPGPELWLCDIVRTIDALDEQASTLRIEYDGGRKIYSFVGGQAKLVFREDIIGDAHVFRLSFSVVIFCDDVFKAACKNAGIKNVMFEIS